jgi:anhydro-N-acetylmuramic acid kinase
LYHQAPAKRDNLIPLAVVNCGGIANITLIKNGEPESLVAFDTGPANGLIDRFIKQQTQGKECMDTDGKYGLQGMVNDEVLKLLFAEAIRKEGKNYFEMIPPKSLDINDMQLIPALHNLSLYDACATLEAFTAESIVKSLDLLKLEKSEIPQTWVLVGGGWNNPVILRELKSRLKKYCGDTVKIYKAAEVGWNSQALEAQIFAYLAVRSLLGLPLSYPGTTRVPQPLTGGVLYTPKTEHKGKIN